ncbi:MAG: outer membrane protein transport protein [bacterium]
MSARGAGLGVALLLAPAAHASVFDTYGFGARAAAMANAHAAASDDYTAVYYNPGALTVHKSPQTGLGIQVIAPALHIDGDAGVEPDANVGVHLGLLFPLGGLIQNRFALGAGLYLPTIQVTRVESFDPSTPHFYRYGALPDKINVALAAAFELHETVSIGLGYQYLGRLDGDAQVEVDLLTRRFTHKDVAVDIRGVGGLTAGLHLRPAEGLSIGLSYREALSIEYAIAVDLLLKDVGRLRALIDGIALYTPAQYTLGRPGGRTTWWSRRIWSGRAGARPPIRRPVSTSPSTASPSTSIPSRRDRPRWTWRPRTP